MSVDAADRLKTRPAMTLRGVGMAAHVRGDEGRLQTLVLGEASVVDDVVAARLPQRLRLVRQLEHASLVRVLDGGADNGEGRPWLLEQAAAGRTLRQQLDEDGAFSWEDALQVALDVLNGLEYVHRRGLLHGGLSPAQVLVTSDAGRRDGRRRGRLLETGVTHLLRRARSTPFGPLRVDADYAAPEAIRGEPLTPAADVYSAALLIQESFSGRHPIPAPARNRLLHRLNESARRLEPAARVDDEAREDAVRQALARATQKDPALRFGSARAFALALSGQDVDDAGEVVAPDGGTCAGCEARVPPRDRRHWSRHDSDRPFTCARCERLFCGAQHWDRLGWTCTECGERALRPEAPTRDEVVRLDGAPPLPTPAAPESAGPTGSIATKEDDVVVRKRTLEKARRPSERLLALRELLTSSKEGRPSLDVGEALAPAQQGSRHREAADQAGGEELFLGAWEREKQRRTTALARAEEARGRSKGSDDSDDSADDLRASGDSETERLARPGGEATRPGTGTHARPSQRPGSGTHARPSQRPGSGAHARPSQRSSTGTHARPSAANRRPTQGRAGDGRAMGRPATASLGGAPQRPVWQVASGVLLVALVYMAWGWQSQLSRFAERERELEQKLTALAASSTDTQLLGERSDQELRTVRRERDTARTELVELEDRRQTLGSRLGEVEATLARARGEVEQLEQSEAALLRRVAERDAELGRVEAEATKAALALERERRTVQELERERARLLGELGELRPRSLALTAPAQLVPVEPRRLSWPEGAAAALAAGRRGEAWVALRLVSRGPAPRVLVDGRPLAAGAPERRGETEVRRYWLDAERCAALADAPPSLAAGLDGGPALTQVESLELLVFPLAADVAQRLAELGRRSRW